MTPAEIAAGRRCDKCWNWQRKALDYGHCWSPDRLDNALVNGPVDLTYPGDVCEGFCPGEFDPKVIVAAGGNPDRTYGEAADAQSSRLTEL